VYTIFLNFQGYPASKTLAEKAAWKFAEENNIDLITVIPTLMAGASLTPDVPSSVGLAMSLITGIKTGSQSRLYITILIASICRLVY
jgi:nucleoside-diphosphate-sugar epimerase